MELEFFEYDILEQELAKLPRFHRVAFAASCCERILPVYNFFCKMYHDSGDPRILRTALDEVWQILQGKPIDAAIIEQFFYDLSQEDIFPNDLDYASVECFWAKVAVLAISYTLQLILEHNLQLIIWIVKQARDMIEIKIGEDEYDEEDIVSHHFAIREIAKETEDLEQLKLNPTLEPDFIEWLRTSSYNGGKSLID